MNGTTYDYFDIDIRWDAGALPRTTGAEAVVLSAWTTDVELNERADALAEVYATDADDLHDLLHGVRSHLRVAALAAAASPLVSEAVAIVGNLDHLIHAGTSDAQLQAYADAAEAGARGPIPELLKELHRLRDGERASRVFVAETGDSGPDEN